MKPTRLYFVNRYYYPDFSATAQMLTDLATALADDYQVRVVTSRALYNDPLAELARREVCAGVELFRLNTTRMGRASLWGRALDYASFHFRVLVFLLRNVRAGDLVVLKTDPPLLSLMNTAAARLRGGRVVNWLQDLFPEVAIQLGAFPRNRVIAGPLKWWRNRALKAAAANVVISETMRGRLSRQGVENTSVIPNWADGDLIRPLAHDENPLRAEWNPHGKFLVGYSGNFGRAHCFDEMVEAMTLLEFRDEIGFVLIGAGAKLESVLDAVERKHLHHVDFHPYQPHDTLSRSLGAVDVHLVTLAKGMEGLVLPSKIYGVLAAGRPIAFVGETDGEIARFIRDNGLGVTVEYGGGAQLAEQIQQLSQGRERMRNLGANARSYFNRNFSRELATERWLALLTEVCN